MSDVIDINDATIVYAEHHIFETYIRFQSISVMEEVIVCPNCGEEENFHFNYDYSKKEMPIEDVLCNECGTFFEIK